MSEKTTFRPLDFIRHVIEHDDALTSTEKSVLTALAIGTDNATFKVRRSLKGIGRAANVDRSYVSKLLDGPRVHRYVAQIQRQPRRVEIWLRQEPLPLAGSMRTESASTDEAASLPHAEPVHLRCGPSQHGLRTQSTPSATSLPPSAPTASPPAGGFRRAILERLDSARDDEADSYDDEEISSFYDEDEIPSFDDAEPEDREQGVRDERQHVARRWEPSPVGWRRRYLAER